MALTSDPKSPTDCLKDYLEKNPGEALRVAISHHQRWSTLETENAKLEIQSAQQTKQNQQLKAENSLLVKRCERLAKENHQLKYSKSPKPTSLSQLLNSKKS